MNRDIHPELGKKLRFRSIEDCLKHVRRLYPTIVMEGSTGAERSFWLGRELIGHAWPVRSSTDFWLRLKPSEEAVAFSS